MAVKISDDNNIPELIEKLSGMKNKKIEAGVLEDGEQAMIAAVHEFGIDIAVTPRMRAYLHYMDIHLRKDTTHIHIPERSFIRKMADEDMGKVMERIEELLPFIMTNDMDADKFLDMTGELMKDKIKLKIKEVSTPPLSDVTVEKKGSSTPLEDTGSLSDSIDYRVT